MFELLEPKSIGPITLSSLEQHSDSLSTLSLKLDPTSFYSLLPFGHYPQLRTLKIDGWPIRTETTDIPKRSEASAWLKSCRGLRSLEFPNPLFDELLITEFLLEDIQLQTLKLCPHNIYYEKAFCRALAAKSSLRELHFTFINIGELGQNDFGFHQEDLLEAILSLKSLESLYIGHKELREEFTISVGKRLTNLRSFQIACGCLTDAIWPSMQNMKSLKSFIVDCENVFSFDGILSFISNLGPGNEGLYIQLNSPSSILTEERMIALQSPDLTEEQIMSIDPPRCTDEQILFMKSILKEKVGGMLVIRWRLDYVDPMLN